MSDCAVVELRRYDMVPGKRDDLIALFENEFVETQEASGMVPVGHFRDRDRADQFVWFREFPAMARRAEALASFYTGPTWLAHRAAANATIVDSDNVLLLRAARPGSGFELRGLERSARGESNGRPASIVAATVYMLARPADEECIAAFEDGVVSELRVFAQRVASFVTEERPNDYPALPVRESDYAFVVTGICANEEALEGWTRMSDPLRFPEALGARVTSHEILRLEPAARSLFR